MFDFLKKKIGGFIDGLTKKEAKPEEASPAAVEPAEKIGEIALPEIEEKPPEPKQVARAEEKKGKPAQPKEKPKPEKAAAPPEKKKIPRPEPAAPAKPAAQPKAAPQITKPPEAPKPVPQITKAPEIARQVQQKPAEAAPASSFPKPEMKKEIPAAGAEEKKRIKLGAISAIKSFITSEVEIKENDVKGMLENFELELLEADVDISVAGAIREELETKLVGSRTPRDRLHAFVGSAIKETLTDMITNEKAFDIVERVSACEKPAKLMFLGINGAGKTTTIAKVARLLMDSDAKVVLAAADTFRAAAIEQAAVHADRLGIKLIKRDYGSDPTSVAYDAVNYAKAHGIDAVLIDTAGRQDTNISLLNEMKKMVRVISPDLKIYIGESIAGNAIIEQISAFNREIGIDAVILTKMDCDPKGGTMLSINRATGIPIIYVGVGQAYSDLEKFDPARIVSRIVD
ncbi:MAG: signal recognition particle-docking protein FtsY [Candidatus ainarchaeum sp.]|nr:signal recognition particle-docking protein FtsY [Candidatus ainarchaeum sp.]